MHTHLILSASHRFWYHQATLAAGGSAEGTLLGANMRRFKLWLCCVCTSCVTSLVQSPLCAPNSSLMKRGGWWQSPCKVRRLTHEPGVASSLEWQIFHIPSNLLLCYFCQWKNAFWELG